MRDKNGFTLGEVLAVITVLGMILIVVISIGLRVLKQANNSLSEYEVEILEDSAKTYMLDYVDGNEFYTYKGDDITLRDTVYKDGDELSYYDFILYVRDNDIKVTVRDLINAGLYKENKNIKDTCNITISFKTTNNKAGYEEIVNYDAKLDNECK